MYVIFHHVVILLYIFLSVLFGWIILDWQYDIWIIEIQIIRMEEYTQAEAYKRLLEIAENILNSTQADPNILDKYHKLKAAMLAKITIDPSSTHTAFNKKLLLSYKYVTGSFLEVITEFQQQIETDMERHNYNKKVIGIVKQWELRIQQLKQSLNEGIHQKQKLIIKEELSALTYYCSELDGKLENLGLLIEVHKKMHEIICQASKSQVQKAKKQQKLMLQVQQLQEQIGQIQNTKRFLDQHRLTESNLHEFKIWSNKLEKVLFQN